jgi:hypothetical protein
MFALWCSRDLRLYVCLEVQQQGDAVCCPFGRRPLRACSWLLGLYVCLEVQQPHCEPAAQAALGAVGALQSQCAETSQYLSDKQQAQMTLDCQRWHGVGRFMLWVPVAQGGNRQGTPSCRCDEHDAGCIAPPPRPSHPLHNH